MRNRQSFSFFSSNKNNTKAVSVIQRPTYGSLDVLPDEVIREILSYLPATHLQRFARVTEPIYKQLSVEKLFKFKHMSDVNDRGWEGTTLQDSNAWVAKQRRELERENVKLRDLVNKDTCFTIVSDGVDALLDEESYIFGKQFLRGVLMGAYLGVVCLALKHINENDYPLYLMLPACLLFFVIIPVTAMMLFGRGVPFVLHLNKVKCDQQQQVVSQGEKALSLAIESYQSYHLPSARGAI